MDIPDIVERFSPNRGERRCGALPDMVVLHYTGMATAEAAIARLADPAAEVSAHYVVAEDGAVVRMVPEAERAWHAGVSRWGAVSDVNSRSIGIEIANPGHAAGCPPFPERQMAAVERLLSAILSRHAIPPERVVGHACVAPGRKHDPGEAFDWRRLALRGLSVWSDPDWPAVRAGGAADAAAFQRAAARFGYPAPGTGLWDGPTLDLWAAFAGRFLQPMAGPMAGGGPTPGGVAHLERLARRWPVREAPRDGP